MAGFTGASPIVTDGLVFAVDAANYESYPGSGTTWTDLAGTSNGTLTNGPTFNSENGGNIDFDGTDDYTDFGNSLPIDGTSAGTISIWAKTSASTSLLFTKYNTNGSNSTAFYVAVVGGAARLITTIPRA
jgi:restriction endonuclease S subunit